MLLRFLEKKINAMDVEMGSTRRAEILGDALARVLDGARLIVRGANTGPGGNAGTVLCAYDDELSDAQFKEIGYYPAQQEWFDCGGYWAGKRSGSKVAPDALARIASAGAPVRLSDGQDWLIPQAVYGFGDGETVMPRKLRMVNGVTVLGAVVDEFADFDAQARAFWTEWTKAIDEGRNAQYPFDGLVSLACAGLAVNYRLTAAEAVNVLGLFDQRNIWEAAKATIGWPTVEAMLKSIAEAEKKNAEAPIPT